MDAAATLVWIAPEPADAAQSRAIASWARARGIRLTSPSAAGADGAAGAAGSGANGGNGASGPATLALSARFDARGADAVETQLDRAREAVAAGDGEAADRALERADATLRAHAEWPQAAWLMAEVERSRATRWRRIEPVDAEAAEAAWRRAAALDGGRVAGVGEERRPDEPSPHPAADATLVLDVAPADAQAWLDGSPLAAARVATHAGAHALLLTWADAPIWASWVDLPPGGSTVRVRTRVAEPCSIADVARARLGADGAADGRHVSCPAWLAAAPSLAGAGAGVRLATCAADRCGPWVDWSAPPPWTWSPPAEAHLRAHWPAWATWALVGVGVGAAIAAGAGVVASGALQGPPAETRFVSGGVRSQ